MVFSEMVNSETYHLLGLGHDMSVNVLLELNCKGRLRVLEENFQGVKLLVVMNPQRGRLVHIRSAPLGT